MFDRRSGVFLPILKRRKVDHFIRHQYSRNDIIPKTVDGSLPKFKQQKVFSNCEYPHECEKRPVMAESTQSQETSVKSFLAMTSSHAPKKYSPPRILKGLVVKRDFAPGCGNRTSCSVSKIHAETSAKPMANQNALDVHVTTKVSLCRDAKETIGEYGKASYQRDDYYQSSSHGDDRIDATILNWRDSDGEESKKAVSAVDHDVVAFSSDEECEKASSTNSNYEAVGNENEIVNVVSVGNRFNCDEVCENPTLEAGSCQGISVGDSVNASSLEWNVQRQKVKEVINVLEEFCREASSVIDSYQEISSYSENAKVINLSESCEKAISHLDDHEGDSVEVEASSVEWNLHRENVKKVINLFEELLSEHKLKGKSNNPVHFEVTSILRKEGKCINVTHRLGLIPGIEIGDKFKWRAELNVVGLHHHFFRGIDYTKKEGKIIATSVVDSGRYAENDESSYNELFPDVLIYSGQGKCRKSRKVDQKMMEGNLALKNSMEAKTPVRVIRKHGEPSETLNSTSSGGKKKIEVYNFVYCGLYFVDSYRQERGKDGNLVLKFVLHRLLGQPKPDWNDLGSRKEHVCVNDISLGMEKIPIRVVNSVDDEKPPIFNYVTNVIYPEFYNPSLPSGCDCRDCLDDKGCHCTSKNEGHIPYSFQEGVVRAMPVIYECGPNCKCFTSCINRVSQRGIRFPLEVFKTKSKGWGVRSQSFISRGSFICEYTGKIILDKEAEEMVDEDEYLFDIGNNCAIQAFRDVQFTPSEAKQYFTIDASRFGNLGRFINHSCTPNLYAQNVLYDHDDRRMPHIMLFAMEDIPPLQELTYDYNYRLGQVCDANGNIKTKKCLCGSIGCIGRMY